MKMLSSALVLTLVLFNGAGAFASQINDQEENNLKKSSTAINLTKIKVDEKWKQELQAEVKGLAQSLHLYTAYCAKSPENNYQTLLGNYDFENMARYMNAVSNTDNGKVRALSARVFKGLENFTINNPDIDKSQIPAILGISDEYQVLARPIALWYGSVRTDWHQSSGKDEK